jgi:hypothetical protein
MTANYSNMNATPKGKQPKTNFKSTSPIVNQRSGGIPKPKPPPQASVPKAGLRVPTHAIPNTNAHVSSIKPVDDGLRKSVVKNHYLETIQDPAHVAGVKIPDIDFTESGTVHLRMVIQTNTGTAGDGIAGVYLGGGVGPGTYSSLQPSETQCAFGNGATTPIVIGAQTGLAAVNSAPFSVAATAAGVNPLQMAGSQYTMLESVFQGFRVVSVSITVECASSYANLQGYAMVGSFPKEATYDAPMSGQSITSLLNSPYTVTQPISLGPMVARYTPSDQSCFSYRDINRLYTTIPAARADDIGGLLAMAYGLPATVAQPVQFTICFNLEYLPKYGSIALGISPSPVDRNAVDEALNAIEKSDACGAATPSGMIAGGDCDFSSAQCQILMGKTSKGTNLVRYSKTPVRKLGSLAPSEQVITNTAPQKSMLAQIGDFLWKVAKKAAPTLLEGLASLL